MIDAINAVPINQSLGNLLKTFNAQFQAADRALQQLASGQTESLHHCLLTLEEAKLSFQFLEQLRTRALAAYQELLREQL